MTETCDVVADNAFKIIPYPLRPPAILYLGLTLVFVGCNDDSSTAAMARTNDESGTLAMAPHSENEPLSPNATVPPTVELRTIVDGQRLALTSGVAQFSFNVPDDVLSIAVMVHGVPEGWYGIDSWIDGDGTPLAESNWSALSGNEDGCRSCRNYVTQGQGISSNIAPNRLNSEVHGGTHMLELVGWIGGLAADELEVSIVAKVGTAMPSNGTVDLNFYFTGAQGWTAESVQTDPYFAATISRFDEVYSTVGLRIGEMTFHDLDTHFATVLIEAAGDTLGNLVSQSVVSMHQGLNIFFVDEILTGDPAFPSIPGVSAAVPNPAYLDGSTASGVAISLRDPLSVPPSDRFLDPPAVGQTLAHELGHALGLFHTSEYDLTTHDIYEDTPENDNRYLMHADGTGDIISPAQQRAIFSHPAVRHAN